MKNIKKLNKIFIILILFLINLFGLKTFAMDYANPDFSNMTKFSQSSNDLELNDNLNFYEFIRVKTDQNNQKKWMMFVIPENFEKCKKLVEKHNLRLCLYDTNTPINTNFIRDYILYPYELENGNVIYATDWNNFDKNIQNCQILRLFIGEDLNEPFDSTLQKQNLFQKKQNLFQKSLNFFSHMGNKFLGSYLGNITNFSFKDCKENNSNSLKQIEEQYETYKYLKFFNDQNYYDNYQNIEKKEEIECDLNFPTNSFNNENDKSITKFITSFSKNSIEELKKLDNKNLNIEFYNEEDTLMCKAQLKLNSSKDYFFIIDFLNKDDKNSDDDGYFPFFCFNETYKIKIKNLSDEEITNGTYTLYDQNNKKDDKKYVNNSDNITINYDDNSSDDDPYENFKPELVLSTKGKNKNSNKIDFDFDISYDDYIYYCFSKNKLKRLRNF